MPIFELYCESCKTEKELLCRVGDAPPSCCGSEMVRKYSNLAMVKNKGQGGYPSRQKFFKGSAPFVGKNAPSTYLNGENPTTKYEHHNWDGKIKEALR